MTKLQEMANKFYLGAVETAKARGQKNNQYKFK